MRHCCGESCRRPGARPAPSLTRGTLGLATCLLSALSVLGCPSSGPTPASQTLIDPTAWSALDVEADPWAQEGAGNTGCGDAGWRAEDELTEIRTGDCSHVTLEQPSLIAVHFGDEVEGMLLHSSLVAEVEGSTAQVELTLGPHSLLAEELAIPSPSGWRPIGWTAPSDLPPGTVVRWHVHNHGANAWKLASLTTVTADAQ